MARIIVSLCVMAQVATATLPPKVLQLDLSRILNQTAYGVEMYFGTPPQKLLVEVDTGSPFLGIPGARSNWCTLASKPCKEYGSYNNKTSTTAKYVSDDFNNALINHGFGDYINDTIRVGGKSFPSTEFGMILDYAASFPAPDAVSGLIGLTPFCYQNYSCAGPAITLQQELIAKGGIGQNTLGVYLGPEDINGTGQIILGGLDRAKQAGTPVTFPVISLRNPIANSSPNLVNFSSISVQRTVSAHDGIKNVTKNFDISPGSYGILDTGNPGWSLPTPVWQYVQNYFHLANDSTYPTYRQVDCKFREPQFERAALLVGFAKDKLKIRIPLERLVTQLSNGNCATAVQPCGSKGQGCAFGDPFLRSAYTYFDFESLTVTMSNVRYTNDSNVVTS